MRTPSDDTLWKIAMALMVLVAGLGLAGQQGLLG